MALIKCPECGKAVSDKAEKCPNCAFPIVNHLPKEKVKQSIGGRDKGILIFFGVIFFALVIGLFSNSDNDNKTNNSSISNSYCIVKETWGAYSKDDLNKIIEYSVNKELTLLQQMINDGRTVHLQPNTKIFVVDAGLVRCEIRLSNDEAVIWVVSESVGKCY